MSRSKFPPPEGMPFPPHSTDEITVDVSINPIGLGAALIRQLVRLAGLNYNEVAERIGAQRSSISYYLNGRRVLYLWKLVALAQASGYGVILTAVPIDRDGRPAPTQAEINGELLTRVKALLGTEPVEGERTVVIPAALAQQIQRTDPIAPIYTASDLAAHPWGLGSEDIDEETAARGDGQ